MVYGNNGRGKTLFVIFQFQKWRDKLAESVGNKFETGIPNPYFKYQKMLNSKRIGQWVQEHPQIVLFLIGLSLRLAWAWATRSSLPVDDADWYRSAAHRIFTDHAYTDNERPTAYWPVGYPFFLSLFVAFGPVARAAIVLVQSVLSSWTAVMIYDLARSLRKGRGHAWIVGLAFCFFPSALSLSSLYLSETLFTFLLFAGFWGAISRTGWKGLVICACSLSAACYVRPVALLLLPLVHGPLFSLRKPGVYFRKTTTVALVVLLTAIPWAYRNHRIFGGVCAYATNLGVNLFIGNNEAANGGYMDSPILDSIEIAYPNEVERSHQFQKRAYAYASSHPRRELQLTIRKLYQLLVPERTNVYESFVTNSDRNFSLQVHVLGVINNLYYLAWFVLFLSVPFWRMFKSEPILFWFGMAFWIQVLFYCAFIAADRYKFPALPFMFTVATYRLSGILSGASHPKGWPPPLSSSSI